MPFWRKLLNLYLYGSLHISLGAASMVLVVLLIWDNTDSYLYLVFTFFATLLMYSVHRIVGIDRMSEFKEEGRYAIIFKYKHHIRIYAVIAALICAIIFFSFSQQIQIFLIPSVLLSAAYTLPILKKKKRLRDFPLIKIFLVSVSWAYVVGTIPLLLSNEQDGLTHLLVFLEKACFIYALTVPFDVRDIEYDSLSNVVTLPKKIGIKKALYTAVVALYLSITACYLLYHLGNYDFNAFLGSTVIYFLCMPLLLKSKEVSSDYYFTGLIDGLILLYGILLISLLY